MRNREEGHPRRAAVPLPVPGEDRVSYRRGF